jgi:hypothetical protein
MSQRAESSQPEPWFLVHRDELHPDVLMEFDAREEAVTALCRAWVDGLAEPGTGADGLRVTVFSETEMFEDPPLRRALARWEEEVVELEANTVTVMEEMFHAGGPPILRPGRRPGP